MRTVRAFRGSLLVSAAVLVLVGLLSRSVTAVATTAVLAVLEVSLSFDNAVVNAKYLRRMSALWQKLFLTVGVVIAVLGMRLVFPVVIVAVSAHLGPSQVIDLALHRPQQYAAALTGAIPAIYSFGGVFLLMLFLDWAFQDKDHHWLRPLEAALEHGGRLAQLPVIVVGVLLLVASRVVPAADSPSVLFAGLTGLLTYLAVSGLDVLFGDDPDNAGDDPPAPGGDAAEARPPRPGAAATVGTAGLSTFLYLEVLDASFSFDGVIGAFAISQNVLVIAAGLGIGALFVRSMTVQLVRHGTLARYRYLEHGAHWAIGALALCLLIELHLHIPEAVTGLLGLTFIGAAYASSVLANRRDTTDAPQPVPAR